MKNLILTVFVFAICCTATRLIAQNVSDVPFNSSLFNFMGPSVMAYDNRYEGIKGTNTFFEEFKPGTIELKKGKFSDVLINYDAYSDNLLAKNEKLKDIVQMRKDMVQTFVMKDEAGQEFTFTKQNVNGTPTFLLDLVRDTISLFCRVSKTIRKAEIGGTYKIDQNNSDEFITSNNYYIAKGGGELQELQKNKKDLLKAFPEYRDQVSAYLKKNKIDFNNYDQMKLVIAYVNSLE